VSVAGQIHPEFLRLWVVLADKQTRKYYALISAEEEIGSEAFMWSQASTFSYNKDSIGKAITYATATHLHLSMHSTAPLAHGQAGQMSSAERLMHGAAHASQRAAPCPAPPHPDVNVDVGARSVVTSAHINDAGVSGEVNVVDDGTHAAVSVAAADWLAASLGGGDVAASGTNVPGGSDDGEDCDGVERGVTHARLQDDAQSDDDDDAEVDILEVILGQDGQREDTECARTRWMSMLVLVSVSALLQL